jgi:hypothetical protein
MLVPTPNLILLQYVLLATTIYNCA